MKTLTIIRHAKSSWETGLPDHQRPLNKRGIEDAKHIGTYLKSNIQIPDIIVSSDAVRAKTTAKLILDEFLSNHPKTIQLNHKLYDFSGGQLKQVVTDLPDSAETAMVFGHNNAVTNFVNIYGDDYIDNVPTCGVISITFNINSWNNLTKGTTIFKVFPKSLRE